MNEFKIKNGLVIDNTQPITSITNNVINLNDTSGQNDLTTTYGIRETFKKIDSISNVYTVSAITSDMLEYKKIRLKSINGETIISNIPNGIFDGQIIELLGEDDTNYLQFNIGGNILLENNYIFNLEENSILSLIYRSMVFDPNPGESCI